MHEIVIESNCRDEETRQLDIEDQLKRSDEINVIMGNAITKEIAKIKQAAKGRVRNKAQAMKRAEKHARALRESASHALGLLTRYRRLVVVRLNYTYYTGLSNTTKIRTALIREIKRQYEPKLVGWQAITEFSGTDSKDLYHCHLLIYLNGRYVWNASRNAEQIRNIINNSKPRRDGVISHASVSRDKGHYFRNEGKPNQLIKLDDADLIKKIDSLVVHLSYLSKSSQCRTAEGDKGIQRLRMINRSQNKKA